MKTILITWSSRGIWRALVQKYLNEWCRVFWIWNWTEPDITHEMYIPIQSDISDFSSNTSLIYKLKDEWIIVDILINNAGVCPDFHDTDINMYKLQKNLSINLIWLIDLTEKILNEKLMKQECHIINISSMAAWITNDVSWAYAPSYKISKIWVNMYTKTLAWRFPNILVSSIDPGRVKTDMWWDNAPLDPSYVADWVYAFSLRRDIPSGKFWREGEIREW